MTVERNIYDLFVKLRQARTYTDQTVSAELTTELLQIARWTGSSKNTQPWEFVVVQDRDTIERLSTYGAFTAFMRGAALIIVMVMDGANPVSEAYDEGRVSERLMLAARSAGLGSGTGWWSSPEAQAQVKQELGIPAHKRVIQGIAFGYPQQNQPQGPNPGRKPLEDIVHWERYGGKDAE